MVTLSPEAMNASGNLATVLRIASRQAAADRRLERERKQVLLEYMVVYVSFPVFVFIIAVHGGYLLPNLPTDAAANGDVANVNGVDVGDLGDVDGGAYETPFYHATVIQGITAGFVAGRLSTGDVRAGATHASIVAAVAVLLFAFLL
ncbi:hypothetical protein [Halovivax sp.]|uniref:hypothetical protein n=1 Tax=Halovivax sp. TaxID=1935978 RepID=UPI0031B8842F